MFTKIVTKVVGTNNERTLKRLHKIAREINLLEPKMQALSDDELRAKTDKFRERYKKGETLDQLLPEAFAVVREASVRTLGLRHFDVQLVGGMVLHGGSIAEMRTGEGKTLVATLPVYLNAIPQKGVHLVTVNDYLASRDAEWMGPIYRFLGLTVGVILSNQQHEEKQKAYVCDVTYGTNNEYGFDYLRDNMAFTTDEKVQRGLYYAIVDEVDSILIDEARTPLIISGPSEDSSELYIAIDKLIPKLTKQEEDEGPGDYLLDEKTKQAFLSEAGHQKVEHLLVEADLLKEGESVYSPANMIYMHYLNACLRAHALFHKDVDYIVKNSEVVIVDEHTGRTMDGRRWSDGLHQAIEAKEGVKVQNENQTLASITFQNYFRIYNKLAGMTGTADTEAFEFRQIYGLGVVVAPTNKPMIRKDHGDQIYLTAREKFNMVINDIKERQKKGQPTLVGTASVEVSEYLSQLLTKDKIQHEVLNAKQHEREAGIIAQAGRPGAITIATNMAGRGTDIVLGGNVEVELEELKNPTDDQIAALKADWQKRHEQVLAAGGLHVIGSERHESRRIDNQLRGRSGRQGDPGSSRFYLSLEDNLMRIFASERVGAIMKRLGMKENEAIEHSFITRAIENAQRKVEGHNFDMRKALLEYDDVASEQRKVIYSQRDELMAAENISETIDAIREDVVNNLINVYVPPQSVEEHWDIPGLERKIEQDFLIKMPISTWLKEDSELHEETLREKILAEFVSHYKSKEENISPEIMRQMEKNLMLQILDIQWKEHLASMDHLREGIHLRGYAQQDPKQAYKREAFKMFSEMLDTLKYDVLNALHSVQIQAEEDLQKMENQQRRQAQQQARHMNYQHADAGSVFQGEAEGQEGEFEAQQPVVRTGPKVGRNDPCPCGSGKKYKQCCGKLN
ncbi:MAG: preprotein translocase subunit SecA [Gammaproteobacteria bacterium]|nr:preprotein translocase subunit SecA [Gammaproteobacteria bacterium]